MTEQLLDDQAVQEARSTVFDAVLALDSDAIHAILMECFVQHGTDTTIADVIVPVLHRIGEEWQAGRLRVMHEHHATQVFRASLSQIQHYGLWADPGTRWVSAGAEPPRRVVLACPPVELHDLPLHLFGAMLRERGWNPTALGANTPWAAVASSVHFVSAQACVLAARRPTTFAAHRSGLMQLARSTPLFLAGPAARSADVPGAFRLPDDWHEAVALVDAQRPDLSSSARIQLA